MRPTILIFLIFLEISVGLRPITPPPSDPCDPKTLTPPQFLRSDQLTVLINGFSESRLHLLASIAAAYSSIPSVAAVLVLWGNPSTPIETLTQFSTNLTNSYYSAAPITVLRQSTASLNSRFLPRPQIATSAVAICDDDVEIDSESVEFAFKIWSSQAPNNLVGFFARSHDLDLEKKTWIYTVHPDKYSIVLTKFMIMNTDYLYKYSCEGAESMAKARALVDEMVNCEDILMNFVAAEESRSGPVLAEARRLRDRGDARNEDGDGPDGGGVRKAGLSSRRGEHRKRRGDCIREFHRVLGRMPLLYSYGKVGRSVGEQGLCEKGGKLVFCDEQV
ncbi:hypothetical protein Syun_024736 [Stephania yunnanensis]|uniref:Glycosyl transferase 64 domain-containing protein n=1 Tax=Stephania yunnanensis TaxID=152371 RepID=A0AAP0EQS9_9MAGN